MHFCVSWVQVWRWMQDGGLGRRHQRPRVQRVGATLRVPVRPAAVQLRRRSLDAHPRLPLQRLHERTGGAVQGLLITHTHGSRRKPGANTRHYRLETNRRGGSSRLRSSISPNKMKKRFIFGANLNPNEFQPDILEAACGNTAPCWRGGNTVILSLWKSLTDSRKRQDWRLVWLYENVPWFYTVTAHRLCEATCLHVNNKNTQFIFILHGAKWIHTHLICVCLY